MQVLDLTDGGPRDYTEVWDLQREIHAEVTAGTRSDTLVLVEHLPVYTAGRRTAPSDRPTTPLATPLVDVDRGGRITWHGPGQLIGYPIVRLAQPVDPVAYVRALERALIRVCEQFAVPAIRVEGRSGVWVRPPRGPDRKIAAIGARIASGVTMHGFALNVANSLAPYLLITACGIDDADITTMARETARPLTIADVRSATLAQLIAQLGPLLATSPAADDEAPTPPMVADGAPPEPPATADYVAPEFPVAATEEPTDPLAAGAADPMSALVSTSTLVSTTAPASTSTPGAPASESDETER